MRPRIAFDDPRRLEWMQAQTLGDFLATARRMQVTTPHALLRVAGGVAAFFGVANPTSVARGVALSEAIGADEFAALVRFYQSRGAEVRVETVPTSHRSLTTLLTARGAKSTLTSRMHLLRLEDGRRTIAPAKGVRVEVIDGSTAEACFDAVGRGFNEGQPTPPAFRDHGPVSFAMPHGRTFLATVDGKPAGGARVSWVDVPRERGGGRVALLSGGSTRPEFRRRGVHAALLEARLVQALAAQCDTACVLCGADTASERNIVRAGFAFVYPRDLLCFA